MSSYNKFTITLCESCGASKKTRNDMIKEGRGKLCRSCAMKSRSSGVYARGKNGPGYKHGKTNTPLHKRWMSMHRRVTDPAKRKYYLDKGITVCEEWKNFEVFEVWALENGYQSGLTIDRIDNSGHYQPGNCRWVTHKINCQNRG